MSEPHMAAGMSLVIFASNLPRLVEFYRQALKLDVGELAPTYVRLHGGAVEIVVHAIPEVIDMQSGIVEPAVAREDATVKPVFIVADLDHVREVSRCAGAQMKPVEAQWRYNGQVVLDGCDPEGNVIQFRQPLPVSGRSPAASE